MDDDFFIRKPKRKKLVEPHEDTDLDPAPVNKRQETASREPSSSKVESTPLSCNSESTHSVATEPTSSGIVVDQNTLEIDDLLSDDDYETPQVERPNYRDLFARTPSLSTDDDVFVAVVRIHLYTPGAELDAGIPLTATSNATFGLVRERFAQSIAIEDPDRYILVHGTSIIYDSTQVKAMVTPSDPQLNVTMMGQYQYNSLLASKKLEAQQILVESLAKEGNTLNEHEIEENLEKIRQEALRQRNVSEADNDINNNNNDYDTEQIRLRLQDGSKELLNVATNPTKTVSSIIDYYRQKRDVPTDKTVKLVLDGDELDPSSTLEDADVDDMCVIDVKVK
ncbi:hypothetical protein CANCADRAFT_78760 [Tortispora caseinolytica NRRL Y-17796]|uniref:Ubiquitin-like domain-containing protein n=1 Tax=Tortispora caseinolytica NRRL Y-17796 TaxID=767744 RepID=A0A1E4TJJ1_9ASCO|nr:hypothetical protein CANCADRAFT_78760 [Tortispora caseinolytica NRRL Y-17796]